MEFGPRALGARSILASPLNASMQARLNEIKDREDFRPVAPVVLEEEAADWFAGADVSPFHNSLALSHILEMMVTSALIPPLALYCRLRGALKFRVIFF